MKHNKETEVGRNLELLQRQFLHGELGFQDKYQLSNDSTRCTF